MMDRVLKKSISLLLIFLLLFQNINCLFVNVYASGDDVLQSESVERSKSFLNFSQYKDEMTLDAKSLSTNDYYTLSAFMSNWYKPGVTTLAELVNAEGDFYSSFSSALGMSSSNQLKEIVKSLGTDVVNGINTGKCTIVDNSNNYVDGNMFLNAILNSVPDNVASKFNSSCLYYEKNGQIAFDFSSDAIRAAFQTVLAYNPDLFLSKNGIQKIDMFYLDAVGNLWGALETARFEGWDKSNKSNKGGSLDSAKLDGVYLILPACLNPSTFTPNAKKQSELRMPLMNKFVFSSLVLEDDLGSDSNYATKFIPIYNVLEGTSDILSQNVLNVIGVHSLSSNIFNIDSNLGNTNNALSFASFVYNDRSFTVKKDSDNKGKTNYASNSYIVFSMSLSGIKTNNNSGSDFAIDMAEGITHFFGANEDNLAFTVFKNSIINEKECENASSMIVHQQDLLEYFFTPTVLNLNKVSMNFYDIDANALDSSGENDIASQYAEYLTSNEDVETLKGGKALVGVSEGALSSQDISKLGLMGMSLYLDDIQIELINDNEGYYLVTPTNMVHSRLVDVLKSGLTVNEYDGALYSQLKSNKILSKVSGSSNTLINVLFQPTLDTTALSTAFSQADSIDLNGGSKGNTATSLSFTEGYKYYILPNLKDIYNVGNANKDITFGRMLGVGDTLIRNTLKLQTNKLKDNQSNVTLSFSDKTAASRAILGLYGYSLFFPSSNFEGVLSGNTKQSVTILGEATENAKNGKSGIVSKDISQNQIMGMYLAYIVDMMGLGTCDAKVGVTFGVFSSPFLPKYNIVASGGNLSLSAMVGASTGVEKSEDLSFEEMQEDLIRRVSSLTDTENNTYRNELIKSILGGFLLTIHRTITGTWSTNIDSVSAGNGSTYQSVTGYIYTPTLEELSFTSSIMNNYIEIYVLLMILIIFMVVLMVLLHMRSWQQGVFITLFMFVALLLPYILISNTINVSNKIADNIYSDRFDFWALTEHYQSRVSLQGSAFMSQKEKWLAEGSATSDATLNGNAGVKIKWMSPKKVEDFQNLYSDSSLSQSFVTNMEIFKWLFSSFIYDSEFVDTDVYGSYVYRNYKTIALEAESYYNWGKDGLQSSSAMGDSSITYESKNYKTISGLKNMLDSVGEDNIKYFTYAIGSLDSEFFTTKAGTPLSYTDIKLEDINKIKQYNWKDGSDLVGTWGLFSDEVSEKIRLMDTTDTISPGVYSNLPQYATSDLDVEDTSYISKAIFLKNTESPFYYFYSTLKERYDGDGNLEFKKALLEGEVFKIKNPQNSMGLNSIKSVNNAYRDFLDLEGLFEYVIPYLKLSNDYVIAWQDVNGFEVEEYNFEYDVNDEGLVDEESVGKDDNGNLINYGSAENEENYSALYAEAVQRKNAVNRVWNMYSPWVDSLYGATDVSESVKFAGKKIHIVDTLNPSYYIKEGRPMIFSEADMIVKGYKYSDLTEVEKKLQAVTEKTYKDLMYLINYYDMDNEVLLTAAAMYATFNFNTEFSETNFLGDSVMLYPQGFELRNFNYDAYMRLALLNATGETIYAKDDLYERVLDKTHIFTALLMIGCDLIACVVIPMFKFVILIGLLFLGLLICLVCVINPPEKIFESITKSLLLPTVLFMALNICFAWVTSLVVGEGLTAYIGSKSLNLATNDPTITILIMLLLGIIYLFCAWKILKFLVDAYKQFGVSTALAAVGVVGSALAAGTAGVAKKGMQLLGDTGAGMIGMGVGAVTAGQGNRLAGAYEGARRGTRGILDQRIREQRTRKDLGGLSLSNSKAVTDSIDAKASNAKGDETSINSKSSYNNDYQNLLNEERKAGIESESTLISSGVNKLNKFGHKAVNAFSAIGSGVNTVAFTATHLPDVVGTGFRKGYNAVENYVGKSIKDIQHDNQRLESINKYRKAQRNYDRFEFKKGLISSEKSKRDIIEEERFNTSTKVRNIKVSALKNEYEDLSPVLRNIAVNADAYNALNSRPVIRMTGVVDKGKKEG